MDRLVSSLLITALVGCGPQPSDPEPGRERGPAEAVEAKEVAGPRPVHPAYYPAGYPEAKIAAAEYARTHRPLDVTPTRPGETPASSFTIRDCMEEVASVEVVELSPTQTETEALARRVAVIESALARYGYRRDLFETPLVDYERNLLALVAEKPLQSHDDPDALAFEDRKQDLLNRLAVDIERRRARLQPGALPISAEGDCGAGEVAFVIVPQPAGGRVWMISRFAFDLCRAQRRDPWNRETCRWAEVSDDRPHYLSGTYVYQARWSNGAMGRGTKRLDGAYADDDEPEIVTVRPD